MQAAKVQVQGVGDVKYPGIFWLGSYEAWTTPQAYPNTFMFEGDVHVIDKNGYWILGRTTCWGDPFVEHGVLKGFVIDSPEMRAANEEMSDHLHAEFAEVLAREEYPVSRMSYVPESLKASLVNQVVQQGKKPFIDKRKQIPCREFANGVNKCKLGRECPYLHSTKNVTCVHFASGRCTKGDECKFKHSVQDVACKFFAQGHCEAGNACKYRHSLSDIPCKFHSENRCTKGALCKYSHKL